jgi:hypothetical protein
MLTVGKIGGGQTQIEIAEVGTCLNANRRENRRGSDSDAPPFQPSLRDSHVNEYRVNSGWSKNLNVHEKKGFEVGSPFCRECQGSGKAGRRCHA